MTIRKRTAIFISLFVVLAFLLSPKTILAENIIPSVIKKVMIINFNPVIESQNNKKLTEYYYWNNPHTLSERYINDVKQVSGDYVNYEIAEWHEVDDFPVKQNGFDFTDNSFLQCVANHNCDGGMVNYQKILTDFQVCEKRNSGAIDELWLWGGPWFGYWEAIMAGPNAFDTNGPVVTNTTCQKQLHIMGFSYERGVSEMLEDLGHRVEGTMTHLFGSWNAYTPTHNWDKFTQTDHYAPGKTACGSVHYAPNSDSDYDWTNTRYVDSTCNAWLNFPNLSGAKESLNCSAWNCDGYGFKKWWLGHLPKALGQTDGKWNNWWRYIVDYEEASQPFKGDLDGNTHVDSADYNILVANFGHPYTIFDYNILVGNWGK